MDKRQVDVRVVADDVTTSPFVTKVTTLVGKVSQVRVFFAPDPHFNSNVVIYAEKVGGKASEVSVITLPQTAQVRIDGQVRGFSPLKVNTTLGKHNIEVSFEGYRSEGVELETSEGIRMVVVLHLAKDANFMSQSKIPSQIDTPDQKKIQVEILDTPTGFLRVRQEPSSQSVEIGRVKPGEKYDYLESSDDNSWHKIQFETTSGWVSAEYAKVSDQI